MRTFQLAQTLALAASVLAAPSIFNPFCTTYTDTYDDLSANSVLTQSSPVGSYHGLSYGAFAVDQQGANGVTGVTPRSAPNVATASLQQDVQQFGSLTLNPFGTISAGPGTSYFNLNSFYFGCSVDTHNKDVGLSSGCTISVVGYDYKGNQLPEQTFAYTLTSTSNAQMSLAALPLSYGFLTSVTFGVATGSVVTAGTTLHLDNLVHCNYS